MFAVIELQGHQYIVRAGDEITVDKLELESSDFSCDAVLLVAEEDGSYVAVWSPYVSGSVVSFEVVNDFQKWEKTRVLKFKRKNRYQRVIGFRPHQTVLKVISIGEAKKAKKAEKAEKTEQVSEEKPEEAPKKTVRKTKKTEEESQ